MESICFIQDNQNRPYVLKYINNEEHFMNEITIFQKINHLDIFSNIIEFGYNKIAKLGYIMYEFHGYPIQIEHLIDKEISEQIITIYNKLHNHGHTHGYISLEHILLNEKTKQIKLINLKYSREITLEDQLYEYEQLFDITQGLIKFPYDKLSNINAFVVAYRNNDVEKFYEYANKINEKIFFLFVEPILDKIHIHNLHANVLKFSIVEFSLSVEHFIYALEHFQYNKKEKLNKHELIDLYYLKLMNSPIQSEIFSYLISEINSNYMKEMIVLLKSINGPREQFLLQYIK